MEKGKSGLGVSGLYSYPPSLPPSLPVVLYAIGLGVFLDQEQDFAGYFSLDGSPHDGCLSYGFGIALSAFIINIIATIVGLLAICYKKMFPSKFQYTVKED